MLSFAFIIASILSILVGILDYVTPRDISFAFFYIAAVAIVAWYSTKFAAYCISALCIIISLCGNLLDGLLQFSNMVVLWNSLTALGFYAVAIELIYRIRGFTDSLEVLVEQRTTDLSEEMKKRQKLELELLNIGEKERLLIGQDLHDGLGQYLTAASLAAKVIEQRSSAGILPKPESANSLVKLLQESIELCKKIAKGLHPVDLHSDGLMRALEELSDTSSRLFNKGCIFVCDTPVVINNNETARQLYRIAQESVNNAIKHSMASHIIIRLETIETGIILEICDNGIGIPSNCLESSGLGLKIMNHRANIIGSKLQFKINSSGGTTVACQIGGDLL